MPGLDRRTIEAGARIGGSAPSGRAGRVEQPPAPHPARVIPRGRDGTPGAKTACRLRRTGSDGGAAPSPRPARGRSREPGRLEIERRAGDRYRERSARPPPVVPRRGRPRTSSLARRHPFGCLRSGPSRAHAPSSPVERTSRPGAGENRPDAPRKVEPRPNRGEHRSRGRRRVPPSRRRLEAAGAARRPVAPPGRRDRRRLAADGRLAPSGAPEHGVPVAPQDRPRSGTDRRSGHRSQRSARGPRPPGTASAAQRIRLAAKRVPPRPSRVRPRDGAPAGRLPVRVAPGSSRGPARGPSGLPPRPRGLDHRPTRSPLPTRIVARLRGRRASRRRCERERGAG